MEHTANGLPALQAPEGPEGHRQGSSRVYRVRICDQCYQLEGEMCHNPECVFCRRTMAEVGEYLDALLIRPVVDGARSAILRDMLHAPRPDCDAEGWHLCTPKSFEVQREESTLRASRGSRVCESGGVIPEDTQRHGIDVPKQANSITPSPVLLVLEYVQHKPECRRSAFSPNPAHWLTVVAPELKCIPCTCGLAALLSSASLSEQKAPSSEVLAVLSEMNTRADDIFAGEAAPASGETLAEWASRLAAVLLVAQEHR